MKGSDLDGTEPVLFVEQNATKCFSSGSSTVNVHASETAALTSLKLLKRRLPFGVNVY